MSDLSSAHPGSPEGSFRNFSDRHFLAHESICNKLIWLIYKFLYEESKCNLGLLNKRTKNLATPSSYVTTALTSFLISLVYMKETRSVS